MPKNGIYYFDGIKHIVVHESTRFPGQDKDFVLAPILKISIFLPILKYSEFLFGLKSILHSPLYVCSYTSVGVPVIARLVSNCEDVRIHVY